MEGQGVRWSHNAHREPRPGWGCSGGGMGQHPAGRVSTDQGGSAPTREKPLCCSVSEGLLSSACEWLLNNVLFIQILLGTMCWDCLD